MGRPNIELEKDPFDWGIEIITLIFVVMLIGLPAFYYGDLPNQVPSHYNASGEVDNYSGKSSILVLPVIGLFLYVGLTFLNRFPHIFNYPKEITDDNAESQYRMATKLIRVLRMVTIASFLYINWSTLQNAMNLQSGLGNYFMLITLSVIGLILITYLVMAIKRTT